MMASQSEIVTHESSRLNSLGIPYQFIHVSDGKPVVIVDKMTMNHIITARKSGTDLEGLFICNLGEKQWAASAILNGQHVFSKNLTECKAYRTVLGYSVGHYTRNTRYIGQDPVFRKPKRKTRC